MAYFKQEELIKILSNEEVVLFYLFRAARRCLIQKGCTTGRIETRSNFFTLLSPLWKKFNVDLYTTFYSNHSYINIPTLTNSITRYILSWVSYSSYNLTMFGWWQSFIISISFSTMCSFPFSFGLSITFIAYSLLEFFNFAWRTMAKFPSPRVRPNSYLLKTYSSLLTCLSNFVLRTILDLDFRFLFRSLSWDSFSDLSSTFSFCLSFSWSPFSLFFSVFSCSPFSAAACLSLAACSACSLLCLKIKQ